MDASPPEQTGPSPVCHRHPNRETRLRCVSCDKPICVDCAHQGPVGQKCADCARHTGRGAVIDGRRAVQSSLPPVVTALLVLTVGSYLVQNVFGAFDNGMVQYNQLVARGELWRLASAALLHGGVMHLGFNMYALYLFGPATERGAGSPAFLSLYIASAVTGGTAYYVFGPANGAAVGASGAIFGLFGAWIAVSYGIRHTPAGAAQFRSLAVLLAINLALPAIIPNIAWQAHLGGLAAGALIALAWRNLPAGRSGPVERTLIGVAVTVVALAVAYVT